MDENLQTQARNLKINYLVNIGDGGFFGFALGFASFTTILPLFFSTMTDSAMLIGLIPAIHTIGWQLPQLLTARRISKLSHFKPYVLMATIHERLPLVGLALIAFFLPTLGKNLGLILAFLMLVWQGLGAGFTANAWQNFIGKIIPADFLGTFFGLQSGAANLFASIGAIAAGMILEKVPEAKNFALCFLIAAVLMFISWFLVSLTREPERTFENLPPAEIPLWNQVTDVLKRDRPFLWFIITRMLFQFSMMAFAFFTVYAVRHHNMGETAAGVMTSVLMITQVGSNPILGWLADHWSRKRVLQIGALAASGSAIMAWLAPNLAWFYVVMALEGIASTAYWTIGLAYTLDFGEEHEKPLYVGLANTLLVPASILAPIIGGALADSASYSSTFIFAAFAGLVTALVMQIFVKEPLKRTQIAQT